MDSQHWEGFLILPLPNFSNILLIPTLVNIYVVTIIPATHMRNGQLKMWRVPDPSLVNLNISPIIQVTAQDTEEHAHRPALRYLLLTCA